jgi:predicted dehydrogenase
MKYAVVGVGRMGRRHIYAAKSLKYELVGVFDKSLNSLEDVKKEHNVSDDIIFSSVLELLKIAKPELLIIATTADSHCEITCLAAESGIKYILVEKPMAVSLKECDRMISVCKKNDTLLSVNHQMRFMEQYKIPRELLENDSFGGFKSMTVVGGNIGVSMNGAHFFEAFRFMSGEDAFAVSAWFDPGVVINPRGKMFEDRAGSIRVVTASGKRLYVEIGSEQGHGIEVIYAGRNGLISVNELTGNMNTNVRLPEFSSLPTTRYGMPSDNINKTIAPAEIIGTTASVIDALIKNDNRITEEQGLRTIEILVAAYESADNGGRTVMIDRKLNRERRFPWA